MASINISGLEAVKAALANAPKQIVVKSFAKALSAGAGVIEEVLLSYTPETDYSGSSEELGHLKENITSEVIVDSQGRGGVAKVGFGKKGQIAMHVEYGHRQVGHEPEKKQLGRVPPHPFMRTAVIQAAQPAVTTVARILETELQKTNL